MPEAGISTSQQLGLPCKTGEPEQYAELERLLRESGHWELVSSLDKAAIRAVLDNPRQHEGVLLDLLRQFVSMETRTTMRLRNRR